MATTTYQTGLNPTYAGVQFPHKSIAVNVAINDALFTSPCNLWVGTGGDLKIKLANDSAFVLFKNIPDGYLFQARVLAIDTAANGTTATNIVALPII
jgi:hypothetical protein